MGWKDGCPSCGGHPNSGGVIIHMPDCGKRPAAQDDYDKFVAGIVLNLAAQESRWLMMRSGGGMNMDIAKDAIAAVMARFPDMGELSAVAHDSAMNALLQEFTDGT